MTKPIYIMLEHGISDAQKQIVMQAINEMLSLANMKDRIEVKDFGVWRNNIWMAGNKLIPYQSVDWYVSEAYDQSKKQIYGNSIVMNLLNEPWQKGQPHYDILILKRDLYFNGYNFALGYAATDKLAISSVFRIEQWLPYDKYMHSEVFKTIVMHEIGHMFGLVNSRRPDVEENHGLHCKQPLCIMRQGTSLEPWIKYTNERLGSGKPLCPNCLHDLYNYFANRK